MLLSSLAGCEATRTQWNCRFASRILKDSVKPEWPNLNHDCATPGTRS